MSAVLEVEGLRKRFKIDGSKVDIDSPPRLASS
jgi:hypothetical protein